MISRYCPASNGTTCRQAYQCCGKLCSSTTGSPSPASATCRRAPRTSTKRCVTPGTCGNGRAPEPAGESPAWQARRPLGTEPPAGGGVVIVMGSSSGELLARKEEPGTAAVPVTRITSGWFAGRELELARGMPGIGRTGTGWQRRAGSCQGLADEGRGEFLEVTAGGVG